MMRDKKGVSLAFNSIIIIVIALLVLIVIVFMLMRGSEDLDTGTKCTRAGGRCVDVGACDSQYVIDPDMDDIGPLCDFGATCCSIVPRNT